MKEGSNIKWIVAGVAVVVIGAFWFRAAQNYEEPLHITPKAAHKAVDTLKGLQEEASDGSAVIPLPGREPMPIDDPVKPLKGNSSSAGKGQGSKVIIDNKLPELNTANWITGRVILKGNAPAPKPLAVDANCTAIAKQTFPGQTLMTRDFRVGKDNGLADVIVKLNDIDDTMAGAEMNPILLSVKGCQLHPVVLVCVTGQPVHLRNLDQEFHDLRAVPKIMPNSPLNYMLFPKGPATIMNFQKAEEDVRVTIDERPWAEAYLTIVEHPYFSVTDSNGVFRIPLPPKGNFKIKASHRKLASKSGTVTVSEGKDSVLNFELEYKE